MNDKDLFIGCWFDIVSRYLPLDISEVVVCQFALESNFGRSSLFKQNNNICGMKKPVLRLTLAQDSDSRYAVYNNPLECFFDYMIWLTRVGVTQHYSVDKFFLALKNNRYAEDPDYISKILKLKSQYYG